MLIMLQQDSPDDYVVATGDTNSVQDFVDLAFKAAGLEGESGKYVVRDERFVRPSEVDLLVGDASKARERLGWVPTVGFEELVRRMVSHDLLIESDRV
jgi:GDPmannose 4,6-dehydratase